MDNQKINLEKCVLYVGLNDKDTKKQEMADNKAMEIINRMVTERFGFGTIGFFNGVYKHNDGKSIVNERTIQVILYGVDNLSVFDFVKSVKDLFNQETIGVEMIYNNNGFQFKFECI